MTLTILKGFKALNKSIIIGLEVLVVVAIILTGLVGYGVYRLSRGPVDLTFAQSYIEDALAVEGSDVNFKVGRVVAEWTNLAGPLTLNLERLSLLRDGQPLIEVRDASVTLAKAPLLIGLIRPERLIMRGPVLTLERSMDGELRFALSTATAGSSPDMTAFVRDVLKGMEQDGGYGLFSRIKGVSIVDARLRVADQQQGMTWQLNNVSLAFERMDIGIYGSMGVQLPGDQRFSTIMTYHRERDTLTLSSQFTNFALAAIAGRLTGLDWLRHQRLAVTGNFRFELGLQDFNLKSLQVQAQAPSGLLDTEGLLDKDVPIKDVALDLSFDRTIRQWQLKDFSFQANDVPMKMTGELKAPDDGDYRGKLDMAIASLNHDQMEGLWPEAARGKPIEKWLLQKISQATFSNIQIEIPITTVRKERQLTLLALRPNAQFDFENMNVDYRPPLYPVEDVVGSGVYKNDDTLHIDIKSGHIRDLKLAPSTLRIDELIKPGVGQAYLDMNFSGPLQTAMRYIALDPINKGDKIPVDTNNVLGTGDFHALIDFPTIKDLPPDLVNVAIDAKLHDISLPKLVKGQTLSGGPFELRVKDGTIAFTGKGLLEGRAIALDMAQPVTPKAGQPKIKVTASVDTDDRMRARFGADLDFVQGPMPVDVTFTEQMNGAGTLNLAADLTPTRIYFKALRYEKAPGLAGSAKLDLALNKNMPQSAKGVDIKAPRLAIQGGTLGFGTDKNGIMLKSANLPAFRLGAGDAAVTYRRDGNQMNVNVKGRTLDLEPLLAGDADPEPGPRVQFSANVSTLSFGGDEDMKNADLSVVLNERADLERVQLGATVGGQPAYIRYVPNPAGKMTMEMNAANAGAFLRAMGIYSNMVGGTLSLTGQPMGNNNRDVKGKLVIKKFDVVKAPVLAQLLGSMSLEGIGEQLSNKGIGFERLESGFTWQRRAGQDVMSFTDGRTSGSALGLTFEGVYDRRKKNVDITGTIIPVSGINTFIGKIPLIGQIVTGGSGGALVAATYSVRGPSEKPRTMVNPLSVLTPGILRRIFFEGSPHNPINDGD